MINDPAIMSGEVLRGTVHGKTIELDQDPGLQEGQRVTVLVQTVTSAVAAGEGLKKAFGSWAEDGTEFDEYLKWNRDQRKQTRSEKAP